MIKNLLGKKFSSLTVTALAPKVSVGKAGKKVVAWFCDCDCGCNIKNKIITGGKLASGHTKSCGKQRGKKPVVNLIGEVFGKYTVVAGPFHVGPKRLIQWRCSCNCGCGKQFTMAKHSIMQCGQHGSHYGQPGSIQGRAVNNILGKVFGKYTVVAGPIKPAINQTGMRWRCLCTCGCGKHFIMTRHQLIASGKRGSHAGQLGSREGRYSHGCRKTKLYRTWAGMFTRCYNKNVDSFAYYGGRGITVCKRWRSFINFKNDMGEKPSEQHSIDRINNDGNYCPENCRWATAKEQSLNRRKWKCKHA